MEYVRIAGRVVPKDSITDYANFLRGSRILVRRYGYQGYEDERARLHNKIFNDSGLADTRWGSARKTAHWFESLVGTSMVNDPYIEYNQELVDFDLELEGYISEVLREKTRRS
jgi:predicted AAA+ superfamily ATPase